MVTVVTGANGHIGICLVRRLLELGREVRAIDREAGPWLKALGDSIELRLGDIRDRTFMRSCINAGDTLYHLASVISIAGDKGGLVPSVNIDGARKVAQIALERKVLRMVHFSSIHAFDIDDFEAPITEKTRLSDHHASSYNHSKAQGQTEVLGFVEQGLDVVVVNPCGVIGPYDYKVSLQGVGTRLMMSRQIKPHTIGGFNWVDVRDVVEGALLAEAKGRVGECYILGGHYRSNVDLARTVTEATDIPNTDKIIPMWVLRVLATFFGWMTRITGKENVLTHEGLDTVIANPNMSYQKAVEELGYQPRPLKETLQDTYAWYIEEGQLDALNA